MLIKRVSRLGIASIALVATFYVQAALVDLGLHTFDEDTGLYWLDLTASNNMSYNQVSALLDDQDSDFFGYQYATESQVRELVANSGYSTPYEDNTISHEDAGPALDLITLLGAIPPGPDLVPQTRGWYDFDVFDPLSVEEARIMYQPIDADAGWTESAGHICFGCRRSTGSAGRWKTTSDPIVGSFLITSDISPVPIPAAAWLFLSALGVFGYAGWRKANV